VTVLRYFSPFVAHDRFPQTGEHIFVQRDSRFPIRDLDSANYASNTLWVYDPITRSRYPFFTRRMAFSPLYFVQNGQRIVVGGVDENETEQWLLIERDGVLVRPLCAVERRSVHGTKHGFIYARSVDGRTEIMDCDTRYLWFDRLVWAGEGDWEIVWVDPQTDSYGPFRPWVQLAEPIYDQPPPEVTTPPAPFPTPSRCFLLAMPPSSRPSTARCFTCATPLAWTARSSSICRIASASH